ncbi:MAG: hypothetical protein R3304_03060 [Longimicrobiales bacterium]|nr:hypothetical protein [Longimicrobiales bacterium]
MYRLLRSILPVLALGVLILPDGAHGQLREIVAKSVSASSSGASLELTFADERELEVSFENGSVSVDGESIGSYEPGSDLDAAWRALLGDAMGLENGPLADRLVAWEVPEDLAGEARATATTVDEALEEALQVSTASASATVQSRIMVSGSEDGTLAEALLRSVDRLGLLGEALEGLSTGDRLRIHVEEDVVVPEGSVVEGSMVVIEGMLTIEGEIRGDVVVVDGSVEILETGVVHGELRAADARILRNRGEIGGGIVDVLETERDLERELRDRIREEIRAEIRSDLRNEIRNVTRMDHDDDFSIMAPFRPVIRGVGGVLEKLILVFVLAVVGAGFLAFAGENMETISETARRSPGRAAMVGVAGSFLLLPVWILGAVALAISIVGIPVAIAWLPLFPLAAGLAALLGYLAVAQNTGEWLARTDFPWTGWIERSNPVYTMVAGLIGLLLAFIAGHVISIAPFLDFLAGLLFAVGIIVTIVAVQIGFGAVLLTRGGRRPEYRGAYDTYDTDVAWEAAMQADMDVNVDDGLGADADPGNDG